ncbi:MAG: menaquinone biosynthesis protein [Cyanobacteria bacterium TGS_CYA1]|nr:menaquinone biosynthesis protein [Cyanobacteria bacterium TGS_CYA1]
MKTISKIGLIDFANCLPVLLPITTKRVDFNFELVLGNPQQLNRLMANDELDAASVSLFYYLDQKERLELFKTISISSFSPVGSVELYSKIPVEDLDGKTIQVPKSSATSINMMRMLLLEEFGAKPDLEEMEEPDCFDLNCDAALVIGDRALLVEEEWASKRPIKIDLASWWFNWTKLPAVFGVWVYKKSLEAENSTKIDSLAKTFACARDLGLTDLIDNVIKEAAGRFEGKVDEARLLRYYTKELNFDFSSLHQDAIDHYARLCRKYDLF